jgi:hypothetical protein
MTVSVVSLSACDVLGLSDMIKVLIIPIHFYIHFSNAGINVWKGYQPHPRTLRRKKSPAKISTQCDTKARHVLTLNHDALLS